MELSRSELIGTRWNFGGRNDRALTDSFRFGQSGDIQGYRHDNEATWALDGDSLKIFQRSGNLMWVSERVYQDPDGRRNIALKTPIDPRVEFVLSEFKTPLGAADFLFPKDLRVTPTKLKKILLLGSCLSNLYREQLSIRQPDVKFDFTLFNFAGDLPSAPPSPIDTYDLQYVQLPVRSVVSDRVIRANRFNESAFAKEILTDGFNVIDVLLRAAMTYNKAHGILSLVPTFFVPQMSCGASLRASHGPMDLAYIVRRLNEYLGEAIDKYPNTYLVDVNAIGDSVGKRYFLDDSIYFYSHGSVLAQPDEDLSRDARIEPIPTMAQFYESKRDDFFEAVYEQIVATYRTVHQIDQVKAVVFDLDNTLWRGQIAEHYRPAGGPWPPPDGWPMGIWEAIHHLRSRGILVAVCSKNDRSLVEKHWPNAVRPEFFNLNDFASVKINWQSKVDNIRTICEEFNIKPKSVVFVDDNPVERAAVQSALPGVRVIGSNPYLTRRILLWSPETQVARLTDESARREDMVRRQISREETRAVMTTEQFLATLGSTVTFTTIGDPNHAEFGRALELINKTNQFNTTGMRWSHGEMTKFFAGGGLLLAFKVVDKFADYGLVGALLIKGLGIAQFVMSCRVLGMEVEISAVAHAVALIRRGSNGFISAPLKETPDNTPCRGVYLKSGFKAPEVSDSDCQFLLSPETLVQIPAHIKINNQT